MATAFENLIKHPKLAIRQLEELSTTKKPVADENQPIDLADHITALAAIPNNMKGSEVFTAPRRIVNTTSLNTLSRG